jgi:hypothetical protein
VSNPPPKSLDLETSAGRVLVKIDRDVRLSVDAVSGLLGNVRPRGLAIEEDYSVATRSSLVAALNGGGALLRARTAGGIIQLVGRDPLEAVGKAP